MKPWYKVITPREDLREGRPLDASEFAVHLDQIRDGRAPDDYQDPQRFFERTFLTKNLKLLAVEILKRLSGITTETSAVFNMSTQFGGGKTHALALLLHLFSGSKDAQTWLGVNQILENVNITKIPKVKCAVFVGTEFDSIVGRGGKHGEPHRYTPWGEIVWQLGGKSAFEIIKQHDEQLVAPGNDVIRSFLPEDQPCLILLDELMNYISRSRKSGLSTQLYNFLHNLSEEARGRKNTVLVVSIPASELEMSEEDQSDFARLSKMLNRLGKTVLISAGVETSEIILRRLFESDILLEDVNETCRAYSDHIIKHRKFVGDFPVDHAHRLFKASYPFHPTVISVFERKWQALPRFQRTRGILRLLALWVSNAYRNGFLGAHQDPLITLGSAPFEDPIFRAAIFEQLGESKLEGAVTTDIGGKPEANAYRLDNEAVDTIKKARLYQKIASTIFFESNGGQTREFATLAEVRLSVMNPEIDIANIETVLEGLTENCYYLIVERNRFYFSLKPNLNKILTDRKATIDTKRIDDVVEVEIQKQFEKQKNIEIVFFPKKSSQIPDRPIITLVVLGPNNSLTNEKEAKKIVETFLMEYGELNRTYKSSLIFSVADSAVMLTQDTRKLLAWINIKDESRTLRLVDTQKRQIDERIKITRRELKETIWRTYKNVFLLGNENSVRYVNLGLIHSSSARSLVNLIINRLRQDGDIEDRIGPNFLVRNWPPALKEWSVRSLRDAFYASPQFPKLLDPNKIKETISRGVSLGILAYIGKMNSDSYSPIYYKTDKKIGNMEIRSTLPKDEIEITEDMFIISKKTMESYLSKYGVQDETDKKAIISLIEDGEEKSLKAKKTEISIDSKIKREEEKVLSLSWTGEIPTRKWMTFYTKILSPYSAESSLRINVTVELAPVEGISSDMIVNFKNGLIELGLTNDVKTKQVDK